MYMEMKWINGKSAGTILKRVENAYDVRFYSVTPKIHRRFSVSLGKYRSDEDALHAAKEFQKKTSDELGLTRNMYRKLPDGIHWNDDESNFPVTKNTYEVHIKYKGIDKFILIDESDIEIIDNFTICVTKSSSETAKHYACISEKGTREQKKNKEFGLIQVHRKLTGFTMVDHINRNPLDNRRCNLRETTQKLNNNNRSKPVKASVDSILGIRYHKKDNSWQARIKQDNKEYTKSFSINKYGDEAKNMAIRARQEFNQRFNCANS